MQSALDVSGRPPFHGLPTSLSKACKAGNAHFKTRHASFFSSLFFLPYFQSMVITRLHKNGRTRCDDTERVLTRSAFCKANMATIPGRDKFLWNRLELKEQDESPRSFPLSRGSLFPIHPLRAGDHSPPPASRTLSSSLPPPPPPPRSPTHP